jgi:uncharacterized protein
MLCRSQNFKKALDASKFFHDAVGAGAKAYNSSGPTNRKQIRRLSLKLHLSPNTGQNLFSGYGAGYVAVNNVRYEKSVVVTPQAVAEWAAAGFEQLTAADFEFIAPLQLEIVIFGTGTTQRFPRPELRQAVAASGVGFEIMDTRAACRTYNILAAEGRKVAAAILIE